MQVVAGCAVASYRVRFRLPVLELNLTQDAASGRKSTVLLLGPGLRVTGG